MNTHNIALILVRWLGLLFLAFGVQGALGIAFAHAILAWSMLPDALREHFDYFYAIALWGTPFYLATGIVLLAASKPLGRFISRDVDS